MRFRHTRSRLLKKGICHAERSEASAVPQLKTNKKQILRSAPDDMLGGFFSSLLRMPKSHKKPHKLS